MVKISIPGKSEQSDVMALLAMPGTSVLRMNYDLGWYVLGSGGAQPLLTVRGLGQGVFPQPDKLPANKD